MDSSLDEIGVNVLRAFLNNFIGILFGFIEFLPREIIFRQGIFCMQYIRVRRIPLQSKTFFQSGNSLVRTISGEIESTKGKADLEALCILAYAFLQLLLRLCRSIS